MNDEKTVSSIKIKWQSLVRALGEGVRVYAAPLAVCLVITMSAIGMNLFLDPAAGIDALFSASPWFQCLWVALAFSFFASALSLRMKKKAWTFALHGATLFMTVGWFFLAKLQEGHIFRQFDLFRVLLILLLYFLFLSILPCGDGRNFSRFLVDAAAKSMAAFSGVTIIFIGVLILVFAIGTMFSDVELGIVPNIASILYGIVLPLLMAGALVPKKDYLPYERIVRGFVTYGLLPILAALGTVFYLYLGKILVTCVWPSNEVSPYVIFGSCVGAVFIVFFCGGEESDRVAKGFCRIFPFFWMLPLLMLFICAGMRIAEYGLTPMRALLVLFGLWMAGVLFWMLWKKEAFHAKALPIFASLLLCAALLLPVGNIFSLSKTTQLMRLDRALSQAHMGQHESISPNTEATQEQQRVILSATDYLLSETDIVLRTEDGKTVVRDNFLQSYGFTNIPQQEYVDYGWCVADSAMLDTSGTQYMICDLYQYEDRTYIDVGYVEGVGHIGCDEGFMLVVTDGEEKQLYPMRSGLVQAVGKYNRGEGNWNVFDLDGAPLRVVVHEIDYEKNADGSIRLMNVEFSLLILAQ